MEKIKKAVVATVDFLILDDARTVLDSNASFGERAFAGFSITPWGKAAKILKHSNKGFKSAKKSSGTKGKVNVTVPQNAIDTAKQIKQNNGIPPQEYKGGREFKNDGRDGGQVLPQNITFKEYDIHPHVKGQNRGAERIVIGNDDSVWYTNDHYTTFTRIK